jgi:hypothetical protein
MDNELKVGPQGVEEDTLREEIRKRYKACKAHYEEWDEIAQEDYKFALGEQWTEEEREELKKAARPALTFNRIRPIINLVSGYQRENSARIKVNPEGGEDQVFSEVMDRLLKAIDKWSHLGYKMGYWFDDGLFVGKGWIEALRVFDTDPIRGELDFKQCSPYQVKVDPDCLEYDVNAGAQYVFKVTRLTKEKLKELYPAKKRLIDGFRKDTDDWLANGEGAVLQEGSDDDYGNRPNVTTVTQKSLPQEENELERDMKFTVKEYWRFKRVTRWFVINREDGEPEKFRTKDEAEAFVAEQGFGKAVERQVKEMHVAAMVCGWVLQDEVSPFEPEYSGFPFFRFLADWAPK